MKRGKQRKFSRESIQRKAFLHALAVSLVAYERIRTTKDRAKAVSAYTDGLITVAKRGTLASRRQLAKNFNFKIVQKLVTELATRFVDRKGGYTRVLNLGQRKSDGAHMAIVEFVE